MHFDDLHTFHPGKTIRGKNAGVSPLRPDVERLEYVRRKKQVLCDEHTASQAAKASVRKTRIAQFLEGLRLWIRDRKSVHAHKLPVWSK